MHRELARKQPARVINVEPASRVQLAGQAVIRDELRTVVVQEVHRLYAEGRIEQDYRLGRDAARGQWTAAVTYRARRRPWLARHGLKLTVGALVGLSFAALLTLVWKLLLAVFVVLVPAAVVFSLVVLGVAMLRGRGREVTVETKVRVRG